MVVICCVLVLSTLCTWSPCCAPSHQPVHFWPMVYMAWHWPPKKSECRFRLAQAWKVAIFGDFSVHFLFLFFMEFFFLSSCFCPCFFNSILGRSPPRIPSWNCSKVYTALSLEGWWGWLRQLKDGRNPGLCISPCFQALLSWTGNILQEPLNNNEIMILAQYKASHFSPCTLMSGEWSCGLRRKDDISKTRLHR